MKIALISATIASLQPIEKAFNEEAPNVKLVHVVDTELLSMIDKVTRNPYTRYHQSFFSTTKLSCFCENRCYSTYLFSN